MRKSYYKVMRKSRQRNSRIGYVFTQVRRTEEKQAELAVVRALEHLRELLPSYRDLCGAAPYYYAAGEVKRLEHQLIQVYSADELAHMSEVIQSQLIGMVHAIREAKGCGIELDG